MPFPEFTDHPYLSRQHLDDLRMEVEANTRRGSTRGTITRPGGQVADPAEPMPFDVEVYDAGDKAMLAVRAGNVYLPGGQVIKVPEEKGIASPAAGMTQYLVLTLYRAEDGSISHTYTWEDETSAFTEIITSQRR